MHDSTGCAKGFSIETYTGKFIDITDISPDDICIADIAHSLSLQCRFNGHCRSFYSVAEHSVLVSNVVPKELALVGLLHDGSESYLCDVPRPLKPLLDNYYELEKKVQDAIYAKFGISEYDHEAIKLADNKLLKAEASQLIESKGMHWNLREIPWYDPLMIQCLSPAKAERLFIRRFSELY